MTSDEIQTILDREVSEFEKYGGEVTEDNIVLAQHLEHMVAVYSFILSGLRDGSYSVKELREPLEESTIKKNKGKP
jgi:hypothetical protein